MIIDYQLSLNDVKLLIAKGMVGLGGNHQVVVKSIHFNMESNDRDPSGTQYVSGATVTTEQEIKIK